MKSRVRNVHHAGDGISFLKLQVLLLTYGFYKHSIYFSGLQIFLKIILVCPWSQFVSLNIHRWEAMLRIKSVFKVFIHIFHNILWQQVNIMLFLYLLILAVLFVLTAFKMFWFKSHSFRMLRIKPGEKNFFSSVDPFDVFLKRLTQCLHVIYQ